MKPDVLLTILPQWLFIAVIVIFLIIFLERIYISKKPIMIMGKAFGPPHSESKSEGEKANHDWEEIKCEGNLKELYTLDERGVCKEIPEDKRWNYEILQSIIKKSSEQVIFDHSVRITFPDQRTKEYKSQGQGTIINGVVANMNYTVQDYDGNIAWSGAMVLRLPMEGDINGYWLTTNVTDGKEFFLGVTNLTRLT